MGFLQCFDKQKVFHVTVTGKHKYLILHEHSILFRHNLLHQVSFRYHRTHTGFDADVSAIFNNKHCYVFIDSFFP
jgi:hypothetical protein